MQNFSGKVVGAVFGVANPKEAHVCLKLSIENEQSLKAESVFLSMNQIVQYRESLWGKDLDESDIPGMFLGANVVLDVQQEHTNLIKINDVQILMQGESFKKEGYSKSCLKLSKKRQLKLR